MDMARAQSGHARDCWRGDRLAEERDCTQALGITPSGLPPMCHVRYGLLGSLSNSAAIQASSCRWQGKWTDQPYRALQQHIATAMSSARAQDAFLLKKAE